MTIFKLKHPSNMLWGIVVKFVKAVKSAEAIKDESLKTPVAESLHAEVGKTSSPWLMLPT